MLYRDALRSIALCAGLFASSTADAAMVPAEQTFQATCQELRSGNTESLAELPLEKFPETLAQLRFRTEQSIDCIPVYLSFLASLQPSPRAWRVGRWILWNLAEEARFGHRPNDAYRQLAAKAFTDHLAQRADSPFRHVTRSALRALLERQDDLSAEEVTVAAGLFETTVYAERRVAVVDPRLPLREIMRSADLYRKHIDWFRHPTGIIAFETQALEELLARGLAMTFEQDAPPTLVAALYANLDIAKRTSLGSREIPQKGVMAQRFAMLLKYMDVADQSRDMARQTFTTIAARRKLMRPDYVALPSPVWSEPMRVGYSSQFYIGRCGEHAGPAAQNSTEVSHAAGGKECRYDSTTGYANFDVALVKSFLAQHPGTTFTYAGAYAIHLGSRVRGGHHKGGLRRDEDQTAGVSYSLTGTITIPQCGDLRNCNPIVALSLTDHTADPDPAAQRTTLVQVQAPGSETWATLTASPIEVSRRDGPLNLRITMSRGARHVGACCEFDWANHAISITADAPLARLLFDWPPDMLLEEIYVEAFPEVWPRRERTGPKALIGQELLHVAAKEKGYDARFEGLYARLLQAHVYLESPDMKLSGAELTGLRDAQGLLTLEARAAYLEAARQAFRARRKILQDLDLSSFIGGINKAIEELLTAGDGDLTPTVKFLDGMERSIESAPAREQSDIRAHSAAARSFAAQADRSKTILALMDLRGALRQVLSKWGREIRDLAVEVTQMDPSLAGDDSRI